MMELIKKSDPRYFTQSSNSLYDRHTYKIVFSNGQSENYPSWEQVQSRWFETPTQFLSHVEVIDLKQSKGFQ